MFLGRIPVTRPLLCETVTARTLPELRAARDAAHQADLVELRLDGVADLDVAGALEGRRRPVVVTCRPAWEGGRFDGSEEDRRRILEQALALGAEYVDVEWRAGFDALVRSTGGARVVISNHDFAGIPSDLLDRARAMRASGAEVVKLAVSPHRLSDTLQLREVTREGRAIAIGMGPTGVATRILAARFGSCWTYAGNAVAPGQLPAATMVDVFRFRQLNPETAVYGVVGNPVIHSLSPVMHNAAFEAAELDAVYVPLQAADFSDFLTFAKALDIEGASVTIPFKLDAARSAHHVEEPARKVGAANTIRRSTTGWDATNTDIEGFLAPLIGPAKAGPGKRLAGLRASVLGAGGAARAVVAGLVSEGAQVTVHARQPERARNLAAVFGAAHGPWPPAVESWDLLVNCTPLGSLALSDESPVPTGALRQGLVYDLVYVPAETRLLREARAAGCDTLGGLPMLIAQAERQFAWWTGRPAPEGVMARAAHAALKTRHHEAHEGHETRSLRGAS